MRDGTDNTCRPDWRTIVPDQDGAAACAKGEEHTAEVAGELALAYAALARRRAARSEPEAETPAIPLNQNV